jgi:hypothetical protein
MELNINPPLPKRKDFRIGMLGSGFIVNDCHLVAYRKAGFNPVAIASRTRENAERAARQHSIEKVCDTYEQLLDDPNIDVLDIAVPPNAQLTLIKAACARKTVKGILAQKPLGMDYAEALEAVQACEAAGITLAVNQNMRYDQSVRAAKTLLDNGTLGEPVFATVEMRAIPHWMPWQKDLGWLTLRIMSIHHLDTFRYWFGDPEGIYCSVRTDPRTKFPHTDGICTYILEYANGLRCVAIDDTWSGPAKEGCPKDNYIRWRIEGTDGLAIGDIGWCKDPYTTPSTIRYARKGQEQFEAPIWTESWFPDAFIGTMAQLLIALETGKEPAISGMENLGTMALVEAAYQSAVKSRLIRTSEITGFHAPAKKAVFPIVSLERHSQSIPIWSSEQQPQQTEKKKEGFFRRLFRKSQARTPTGPEPVVVSNFTPRAQQVLALARKEADFLNHNFVGTEHLLLGLIKLGQGVAVNVLQKMGLDLETLRTEVKMQVGTGPDQKMIGNIPYTPRVKKVLALAAKEAKALNHTYVGTEHILLGLLREGDGVAARVLKNLDVDIEQTRQEILKELDPNFASLDGRASGEAQSTIAEPTQQEPQQAAKSEIRSTPGLDLAMVDFAPRAQQVLAHARNEADRFNHAYVSTEHLLLGLIRIGQGVAFNVLQRKGLNLQAVRKEVERLVSPGPDQNATGNTPYTPRAKKILMIASREAKALNHAYVGTEHILLGILRDEDGVAARVLKHYEVDVVQTRKEILKELDPNFEQ